MQSTLLDISEVRKEVKKILALFFSQVFPYPSPLGILITTWGGYSEETGPQQDLVMPETINSTLHIHNC